MDTHSKGTAREWKLRGRRWLSGARSTLLVKLPQSVAQPKTSDLFVRESITVVVNLYCTNDKTND